MHMIRTTETITRVLSQAWGSEVYINNCIWSTHDPKRYALGPFFYRWGLSLRDMKWLAHDHTGSEAEFGSKPRLPDFRFHTVLLSSVMGGLGSLAAPPCHLASPSPLEDILSARHLSPSPTGPVTSKCPWTYCHLPRHLFSQRLQNFSPVEVE